MDISARAFSLVDNPAILCDRHVDARAALGIDQFDSLRHCVAIFAAVRHAKEGMEKKEGQPITVLSEAVVGSSDVVRLMELQEKGWSYVRP
jgi:hypothetical protein